MKPTKTQRQRIQKWIEKWRTRLFLSEWYIDVEYMKSEGSENIPLAEIGSDTDYFEANLRIYPTFFKKDIKFQEHTIVHELCHIHVEELGKCLRLSQEGKLVTRDDYSNKVERLTQRMANIAFREEFGR